MTRPCNCSHCPAFRLFCEGCTTPCRYHRCDRQCRECDVRCGRRTDLAAVVADTGGLALDMELREQPEFRLARYLPQLLNQLEIGSALQRVPDVAVGLARVLTPRGEISRRALPCRYGPVNLRAQWELSELTRLVCVGNCPDEFLEQLWNTQRHDHTWRRIAVLGFNLATSLNFSIYFDDPRLEHLLNVKRTWLTVQRMQETGHLVPIPHLQWATTLDLARQLDYVRARRFHTLTVNLQMARRQEWRTVAAGLALVREQAPGLRLLFAGVTGLRRMRELALQFPSASFTNTSAHFLAQHYRQLDLAPGHGTRLLKTPVEGHPDLILAANVRLYQEFLAGLDGHGPEPRPVPRGEDEFRTTFREVTAALETRFALSHDEAGAAFDRLAADGEILATFRAWLGNGRVDPGFRGAFPGWPGADCLPQPIPTVGQLLAQGRSPLQAFLHLADLACQVDDRLEILAGEAGY
jgi:hypothetical protein